MALTGLFLFAIPKVGFNYDFEAFFPKGDPETVFFNEHRDRFESDNDFIFVALQRDAGIFEKEFLLKAKAFTDNIAKDSLVLSVTSITNLEEYVKTPFSPKPIVRPFVNYENLEEVKKDSTRIFSHPELIPQYVSEDGTDLLIFIKHQPFMSKKNGDLIGATIRSELDKQGITEYKLAGRSIGMGYYINKMQYETLLFIGLSFILIIAFLAISFRSLWGILIPLSVVSLSMGWIVGFMGLVGQPINLVLTVLPSIIFVVAMSDVIHLVSKYIDELRLGREKNEAIRTAYKEVGFATLLTSLTTAIGFLTLLTVDMQPVKAFGIFVSIGVMLAFILAYTYLPALLVLVKKPRISDKPYTENVWYKFLHTLLRNVIRNKKPYFVGSIILVGISVWGTTLVESDYFLLEDLDPKTGLRKDYEYFDKELAGLRPFELSINAVDSERSILESELLAEVAKVDEYLLNVYGLKRTLSIPSILKLAHRTENGGLAKYYTMPGPKDTEKYISRIQKFDKDNMLRLLVDSTETYTRISSTQGDIGLYAVTDKNEAFYDFVEKEVNTNLIDIKMTGTAHLLDINMRSLSGSLTTGLLIAIFIVSLIMGALYKSIKIVLLALVPNVLPLIMLAAILGFTGINLRVSTAIVFTISFGIAVDDTIHFMSKFKLELSKGKSVLYALKRTYLSTGRAIVLTTLILCSGFLLLMFSDFLGTYFIGILISLTLLFALIADLLVLPVLLILFFKQEKA